MKNLRLTQLLSILIITSCSKDENKTEPIAEKPQIFIAGTEYINNKTNMAYWKNGEISTTVLSYNSFFNDISVVGQDIYTIGYVGNSERYPIFFKNLNEVTVDLQSDKQEFRSLVVANDIVYIAYKDSKTSQNIRPYLWQNNQKTFLNEGSSLEDYDSRINAMEVLDGKTHIVDIQK